MAAPSAPFLASPDLVVCLRDTGADLSTGAGGRRLLSDGYQSAMRSWRSRADQAVGATGGPRPWKRPRW